MNAEKKKKILLHILFDGHIEGGQGLYIPQIVINKAIQDVFAPTSDPACSIQEGTLKF